MWRCGITLSDCVGPRQVSWNLGTQDENPMETLRQWQFPTVHRPLGIATMTVNRRDSECVLVPRSVKCRNVVRRARRWRQRRNGWVAPGVQCPVCMISTSFLRLRNSCNFYQGSDRIGWESCSVCTSCKFGQAIDAMIADQLRTKPDALHVFDSAAVEAGSRREWTNWHSDGDPDTKHCTALRDK